MAALTQRERLAALEAAQEAHVTEHALTGQVWTAKLDAIDSRLRGIEGLLQDAPLHLRSECGGRWRLQRRDMVVIGGGAGLASLLWWLAEAASALAGV